jgi:Outer membrane protein beta-barrel domain
MRIVGCVILGTALLVLTPSAGSAQDRRVHLNFGGGPTFNLGDLGEHFQNGWGPAIGVTLESPKNRVGLQFEYAYRWFNIKEDVVFFEATKFSANHTTHQLDVNFVGNLTRRDSAIRGYVIAGPGMYHRTVEITEYVGNGIICDPFWLVCGAYPIDAVVGTRGGWDFGFNIGGGVGIDLGASSEIYIETRYHYVWGPEIKSNIGQTGGGSANGSYWPLTFGFRF